MPEQRENLHIKCQCSKDQCFCVCSLSFISSTAFSSGVCHKSLCKSASFSPFHATLFLWGILLCRENNSFQYCNLVVSCGTGSFTDDTSIFL